MNSIVLVLMALLAGLLFEAVVLYFLPGMLRDSGAVGKNYLGQVIPVSAGLSFFMTVMLVYLFIFGFFTKTDVIFSIFLTGIIGISFLGFIDDMLGNRDTTGLKGHFKALFKGKMTTGGLKAIGGGVIALYLAAGTLLSSAGWIEILLDALVIALFTNLLNLFDLRPGRAVKAFFLFFMIILLLAAGKVNWLLIAPLLGAVLYYFRYDLRAEMMLGDAGSNVLGLSLGYLCIHNLNLIPRIIVLLFLIGMHLYTEKYSLSETIGKVPLLKYLDDLGRRSGVNDQSKENSR